MTEEQLRKIRWLNRAFHAEKAAKAWMAKLERDKSLAQRLSRGLAASGAGSGNSTEDALVRLALTEAETQEKLRALVTVREEITQVIRQLPDGDMQAILVRHFLAYEPFDMIAERMHYSVRTVYRKYCAALDQVVIEWQS